MTPINPISALDLSERKLLSISGDDRKQFLQGLITNDINLVTQTNSIFSAFLTGNGKFMADLFIYEYNNQFIIDIHQKFKDTFLQKLNLYKLRSKVTISEISGKVLLSQDKNFIAKHFSIEKEGSSVISNNQIIAIDNRSKILGCRIVILEPNMENDFSIEDNSLAQYHKLRIDNKIIDGAYDLTIEKSIILEYGYQDIPAINFDKGCYLGQELMTRTYRRGVLRKKIYRIKISDIKQEIQHNSEIIHNEKKIGVFCFGYKKGSDIYGVGLFRIEEVAEFLKKRFKIMLKIDELLLTEDIIIY